MNWDSTWLTTKATLFVVTGFLLLVANVIAAVALGTLILLLLSGLDIGALGGIAAVATTVTVYSAGAAGRERFMRNILARLTFSKSDVAEMDSAIKK